MREMFLWIEIRVLKKNTLELSPLICIPEATMNKFRLFFMAIASMIVGRPIRRVSSTNWMWVRGYEEGVIWRPYKSPSSWDLLIYIPSPSTRIMNRNGDRGSPCLIPLEALKVGDGDPLTNIANKYEDISAYTQDIHSRLKPNAFKISWRNSQCILS